MISNDAVGFKKPRISKLPAWQFRQILFGHGFLRLGDDCKVGLESILCRTNQLKVQSLAPFGESESYSIPRMSKPQSLKRLTSCYLCPILHFALPIDIACGIYAAYIS